jgi:hypothetical protein
MNRFSKHHLAVIFFLGVLSGLALIIIFDRKPQTADAQTPDGKKETAQKAPAQAPISPPPNDINDLSMEVAALRTLYLFKANPDQNSYSSPQELAEWNFYGIRPRAAACAQKFRQRQEADVSKNYVKLLTELRAAFITGQENRINALSEQLDALTDEEDPDLDDKIEITDEARKQAPQALKNFNPQKLAGYIAAYGKDFPQPFGLMYKTMRLNGKGTKPSQEDWKTTYDFVVKEVSWQVAGLDLKEQKKVGDQARKILDKAYGMSNEELKKNGAAGVGLRAELSKLVRQASPTDPLKHVLEQDLAELLSNPRLLPAITAKLEYLKQKGIPEATDVQE